MFSLTLTTLHSQLDEQKNKLAELNFLIGNWNVNVDTRLSAQGPWEKTRATSTIRKTLKSSLLEEDFAGKREGKDFLIKTLFGINNSNSNYQRVFADSEHGVLIEFEGVKNRDTIFFDKTWTYANGNTVKLRVAYYIKSIDEFSVVSMRMPQQAAEWDVTGRMVYKRVGTR